MGRPASQVKQLRRWRLMTDLGGSLLCSLCGKRITDSNDLSVDHIHPKSLGGKNHVNNYQPAHKGCNARRGNNVS